MAFVDSSYIHTIHDVSSASTSAPMFPYNCNIQNLKKIQPHPYTSWCLMFFSWMSWTYSQMSPCHHTMHNGAVSSTGLPTWYRTYSRWTNYSNSGQLYQQRPRNFKVVFFFQGLRTGGQNKSNPTAWHVTHTFFNFDIWGRGCRPILSSRFEYFVHLRYVIQKQPNLPKTAKRSWK